MISCDLALTAPIIKGYFLLITQRFPDCIYTSTAWLRHVNPTYFYMYESPSFSFCKFFFNLFSSISLQSGFYPREPGLCSSFGACKVVIPYTKTHHDSEVFHWKPCSEMISWPLQVSEICLRFWLGFALNLIQIFHKLFLLHEWSFCFRCGFPCFLPVLVTLSWCLITTSSPSVTPMEWMQVWRCHLGYHFAVYGSFCLSWDREGTQK